MYEKYEKLEPRYEKTSSKITGTFLDETGTPVPSASFTAITMSLFLLDDSAPIINGRDNQNILNANNCTVDANGLFTWNVQPADRAMVGSGGSEIHRAEIRYKWNAGASEGVVVIDLPINNLKKTV